MTNTFKGLFTLAALAWASQACAQITFYESEGFRGRTFTADQAVPDLQRHGFNDQASSAVVGGATWLVCEDASFGGRCNMLQPGRYATLSAMGLNNRVSSVRRASDDVARPNPSTGRYDERSMPGDGGNYGRRPNERLYQAKVLTAHAVMGPVEQRCWVSREQVGRDRSDNRVGAGIAGALIGGILGHQIGGGTGKDLATVGGALAGASIGANAAKGDDGQAMGHRNVQRCANVSGWEQPVYWEVTYRYRGQVHQMQTNRQPGNTVSVNRQGEPRY